MFFIYNNTNINKSPHFMANGIALLLLYYYIIIHNTYQHEKNKWYENNSPTIYQQISKHADCRNLTQLLSIISYFQVISRWIFNLDSDVSESHDVRVSYLHWNYSLFSTSFTYSVNYPYFSKRSRLSCHLG